MTMFNIEFVLNQLNLLRQKAIVYDCCFLCIVQVYEGHLMDALALGGDEGRERLR